jgi:hypothetical protein
MKIKMKKKKIHVKMVSCTPLSLRGKHCGFLKDVRYIVRSSIYRYEEDNPLIVGAKHIRPRSNVKLELDKIRVGDRVIVNHNVDEPGTRGYWYDAVVRSKQNKRTSKSLTVTIFMG